MTVCVNPDTSRRVAELFENVDALESGGIGALSANDSNLPLKRLAIRSQVSGVSCQTTIAQVFANPHRAFVEATYIFPLPGRFAVTSCVMQIGGRKIEADLQERSEARANYNRAIAAGHRAAIAEEDRSETFSLCVGNIPPQEEVVVELTLVGNISIVGGEGTLRIPLVVAPRYVPGTLLEGPSVGLGVEQDTDEAPDASRVTPPTLLAGCPNPVALSLEVDLDPGIVAKDPSWRNSIRSSLHSVFMSETTPVRIKLLPGERLNRDFILRFPVLPAAAAGVAEFAVGKDKTLGTFAVTIFPPTDCVRTTKPRDVVFVLDRSGSMEGWKIVAARRAMARMVDSLREADRFRVFAFDNAITSSHPQGTDFQIATDRERWQAAEWIAKINARGGTELAGALHAALKPFATFGMPADRDAVVVLITDGQVAGEDSVLRTIESLQLPRMPRIFTLGIDRAVNAGLLTRLANLGGGTFELIESEERLDQVLERVHQQIAAPVLTDVKVESLDCDLIQNSLTPSSNQHVFADRPLTILGRCGHDPKGVRLRISARDANGGTWQQEITAERTNSSMLLPLWGRSRVRELEDRYARSSSQALQNQIVAVSLESHILSRFTAYVAVDHAEVVNKGGEQHQIVQPVEEPEGWLLRNQVLYSTFPLLSTSQDGNAYDDMLFESASEQAASLPYPAHSAKKRRAASSTPAPAAGSASIPQEIIELIPESVVRENIVLPIAEKGNTLVVRMSDPNDLDTIDKLRFILNRPIEALPGDRDAILEDINKHYPPGGEGSAGSVLQEFTDTAIGYTSFQACMFIDPKSRAPEQIEYLIEDVTFEEDGGLVEQFVDTTLKAAMRDRASHIVLQPDQESVEIQFLIHRFLKWQFCWARYLYSAIVSRLKILAKLDIARRDNLQIGTIKVNIENEDLELCVVFIPLPEGRQAVILRLLRTPPIPPHKFCYKELAPWLEAAATADAELGKKVHELLCN